MNPQRAIGYTCHSCREVAVVDLDGGNLCARHAINAMITVDLRAEEPIITISNG